jgi:3-hydroxybutyryl-CoA dehydrogenase
LSRTTAAISCHPTLTIQSKLAPLGSPVFGWQHGSCSWEDFYCRHPQSDDPNGRPQQAPNRRMWHKTMTNRTVQEIAIVGLGTMGCGIAECALLHGFRTRVVDMSLDDTAAGIERIRSRVARQVKAGLVGTELLAAVDTIYPGKSVEETCDGVDLIIEAVPEDWTVKSTVLRAISAGQPGIIATNTSSFPIERLEENVADTGAFLGAHFFNPAEWIPGVEVIPGPHTRPEVIEQVFEVLKRLEKAPALVRSSPGFLANRLQLALFLECLRCVEEGLATPDDVDTVVSSTFGFRLPAFGPFAVADMAGLDVYASILDLLEEHFGERFSGPSTLRALVADGAYGVKSGRGFRTHADGAGEQTLDRRDAAYIHLRQAVNIRS